jgi:MFS family permease
MPEPSNKLIFSQTSIIKQQAPNQKPTLMFIFIITMFMSLGAYYNFDLPQIYEDVIIHQFDVSPVEVESLYSIYSSPNFIFTPLGSLMLSFTGLGLGMVITNALVFFGSLVIASGFYFNQFKWVFLGRGLFGMGAEVAIICQATISEKWFSGKALSFSQAINRTISFMGISFAVFMGPKILIEKRTMDTSLFLYSVVAFFSFMISVVYCVFEIFYEKKHGQVGPLVQMTASKLEQFEASQSKFKLRNLKQFSPLFWLLAVVFAVGSQSYLMFISFSTDCMMNRFGYDYEGAKNMIFLVPLFCIVFMPVLSLLISKYGKKGFWLFFSFALGGAAFFLMSRMPVMPANYMYFFMAAIALHYSIFVATIWPSMTLSVPPQATAVALGLATTFQNVFITSLPTLFGLLNKARTVRNYNTSLFCLVCINVFGIIVMVMVIVLDFKTGKRIHLPENDPRVEKMRLAMAKEFADEKPKANGDGYKSMGTKSTYDTESPEFVRRGSFIKSNDAEI